MTWATEAEVLAVTGTSVDAAQLAQAQGHIELHAGVPVAYDDLTVRDARLLKLAVAYQAVWLGSQIDVDSRVEVSKLSQDGVSLEPAHPDALILAPLARRALAGLSWRRRTGTVTVRSSAAGYSTFGEWAAAWMTDEAPDLPGYHQGTWPV